MRAGTSGPGGGGTPVGAAGTRGRWGNPWEIGASRPVGGTAVSVGGRQRVRGG